MYYYRRTINYIVQKTPDLTSTEIYEEQKRINNAKPLSEEEIAERESILTTQGKF